MAKQNSKSKKVKIKAKAKNVKNPAKKNSSKAIKKPASKKIAAKKSPAKKTNKSADIKTKKAVAAKKLIEKNSKNKKESIKKEVIKKEVIKKEAAKTVLPTVKNTPATEVTKTKKATEASKSSKSNSFKVGHYAVYPSHGVGKITDIEKTVVLGRDFSCYIMNFDKEKLNIKIPINTAEKIGLRHLVTKEKMDEIFGILRSGVKKLKGMWSRRAQEYETKINSGDIILLAEVLRDLTRDIEDSERSYSERIIYETAINRLASEYSAVYNIDFEEAREKVITTAKDKLASENPKTPKRDEFDEFDEFDRDSERDEDDEESEDEDDEDEDDEDDDFDYDDEDDEDEKPRKRGRK